ncbi:hypothetical protein P7D93_18185 [Enterococcus raffinosus]|uniref:hypothetical protein n=1 Tax=Enterococcus raffinosus TaxID=71452 RepID=UPI00288DB803|nr:hypothetical protein [Enterococcus raffinosus]MDT2531808.1 hypothetical protein [Enterococcus raffinosus]
MKLVDYIREGYSIVTSPRIAKEIRNAYPESRVFTNNAFDALPCEKLLVDKYYAHHPAVISAKPLQKSFAIEMFNYDFLGVEMVLPVTGEAGRKSLELLTKQIAKLSNVSNTNLLEIKLKDTDSVPEVWYKGERLDELPKGLVDVNYHWHTTGDRPDGANDVHIEYYDSDRSEFLDLKTIGHKRMI